jgi:hypothetical protein
MQICDNKSHFGKIFDLDKEAIGYNSIEEAIELTRYFIEHDDERRCIAAEGWKRAIRDYNEVACFKRVVDSVEEIRSSKQIVIPTQELTVSLPRNVGKLKRIVNRIALALWTGLHKTNLIVRGLCRKTLIFVTNFRLKASAVFRHV